MKGIEFVKDKLARSRSTIILAYPPKLKTLRICNSVAEINLQSQ